MLLISDIKYLIVVQYFTKKFNHMHTTTEYCIHFSDTNVTKTKTLFKKYNLRNSNLNLNEVPTTSIHIASVD